MEQFLFFTAHAYLPSGRVSGFKDAEPRLCPDPWSHPKRERDPGAEGNSKDRNAKILMNIKENQRFCSILSFTPRRNTQAERHKGIATQACRERNREGGTKDFISKLRNQNETSYGLEKRVKKIRKMCERMRRSTTIIYQTNLLFSHRCSRSFRVPFLLSFLIPLVNKLQPTTPTRNIVCLGLSFPQDPRTKSKGPIRKDSDWLIFQES